MKKAVIQDVKSDNDEDEMIKSEKLQVLTVLPKSWTVKKIESEFGVSNYVARKTKNLVRERGILATPNPKLGHPLAPKTAALVCSFYDSDEVSRMMPGKKDFISIKQGEERVHKQKRLVLSNLKEVYQLFKDKFPTLSIGFSKFAELRPRHCVLAGASGTHSVCVCTIHQNVKLMMIGGRLSDLTAHSEQHTNTA